MTTEQLTQQLTNEGLRLAANDPQGGLPEACEAGWTYSYLTDEGERVTVWVTELQ